MEEEIIKKYQEDNLSIEKLSSLFKIGKIKVKKILIKNNIQIKSKGNQNKNKRFIPFNIDIENKILKCKKCNTEYNDIENRSGGPISHIKKCFPDLIIPTKYIRNEYKKENGIYWHFQYFDIVEKKHKNVLKCPICNWETNDIINKSGSFTKHIETKHDSIESFLEKYPEYKKYFKLYNQYVDKKNKLNNDFVICRLCNKKMKVVSNSHLSKVHNMSSSEYKLLYPNEKLVSIETNKIFKENLKIASINIEPVWSSSGEIEIFNFIKELGFNPIKGKNRKILNGKEIDIIVPEKKICFEYDGLYYHTENMGKNSTYHLNKTIEAYQQGYILYHIFEDEWIKKPILIKNKIKHILNVNDGIKIGGRNVTILKIKSKDKSIFLDKNHIQGNDNSIIHYGAFYNNELVGVICFNKKRNMTKTLNNQYELSRFCVKNGYIIYGLFSKFIKNFINEYNPYSIITFADRRWSPDINNNVYIKSGFSLVDILKPTYYYYNSKIDKYKRFHKFGYGKNNLRRKYPNLDYSKSEKEIMNELGYNRIWDCGLFKYQLICNKKGD